jgi:hypothetical protein
MSPSNDCSKLTTTLGNNLIISVGEAKKILGKKYITMTDEDIESLIINLQFNAETTLLQNGS